MPETTSPRPFRSAAPRRGAGPYGHVGYVGDADWRSGLGGADRHLPDVVHAAQVAQASNHVLAPAHLEYPGPDVHLVVTDRMHDAGDGDTERAKTLGNDLHLVLLLEATQAGHLRYAGHGRELKPDVPVLQGPQGGQVETVRLEYVLVDPAYSCRVGPQRRLNPARELRPDAVQVLQHPGARPVDVGPVLEDHVHEAEPEERVGPHVLRPRHLEHLGGDRVGDLVLHDLRSLLAEVRLDYDLYIGQIRDRVQRCRAHRPPPGTHQGQRGEHHQHPVSDGCFYDPLNHAGAPRPGPARARPPAAFPAGRLRGPRAACQAFPRRWPPAATRRPRGNSPRPRSAHPG